MERHSLCLRHCLVVCLYIYDLRSLFFRSNNKQHKFHQYVVQASKTFATRGIRVLEKHKTSRVLVWSLISLWPSFSPSSQQQQQTRREEREHGRLVLASDGGVLVELINVRPEKEAQQKRRQRMKARKIVIVYFVPFYFFNKVEDSRFRVSSLCLLAAACCLPRDGPRSSAQARIYIISFDFDYTKSALVHFRDLISAAAAAATATTTVCPEEESGVVCLLPFCFSASFASLLALSFSVASFPFL